MKSLFVILIGLAFCPAAVADEAALDEALGLLLGGNYEESAERYEALVDDEPAPATLGLVRTKMAVGDYEAAKELLEQALEKYPKESPLHAEAAWLAFQRGDYEAATTAAKGAIALDGNSLPARWVTAELLRTAGKLDEADKAYKWFVDYYNANDVADAESLRTIGLAAAQYARWHRLNRQFGFLVNDLYPDALKADKRYWPAVYESGLLFLEKYNQAQASQELKDALKLNPNAAEVYAALGQLALQNYDLDDARRNYERALEINPNLLAARHVKSDYLLANFDTEESVELLEDSLSLNPMSEETLGRLAAAYVLLDGLKDDEESRFNKLRQRVIEQNPHCGEFFFTLATRLSDRRKFNEAEPFFKEALERMPQLIAVRGELGLMYMRLGEEVLAEKLLNESFEIDPFNVRVSNTLKVLDVLSGYAVIETEHFIVKFDRGRDEILARLSAEYLENEVYPVLTKQFGFEPQGKSLFEIFNRAKNTRGHGWFSARMVGLPYIGTVGACAGKMVALASPNDMDEKFNWARVLKHEFVHVLNLQQTNFNIPHWYTEALAVINEGYPRPEVWNQLLADRVPKDELFDLDTINLGFIRPKSSLDWQMAYCQAELYAEYMLHKYGDDALAKMLTAYADNLSTADALQRSFDVSQEDFERGYLEYVKKIVAELTPGKQPPKPLALAELIRAVEDKPEDADLAARLAEAHLGRKSYPQAREMARKSIELSPKHQLATYVLARIHLLVGDTEEAEKILTECLDEESPDDNVINLLAALKLKAEDHAAAAKLYELAEKHSPHDSKWTKLLARVHLLSGDEEKLAVCLTKLAEADADDFISRKKLAQLALAGEDFARAADWATQAIQVDVTDADVHRMAAEAWSGAKQPAKSAAAYEFAVRLAPNDIDLRLAWAKAAIAAADKPLARRVLKELLEKDSEHAEARELLEELGEG